MVICLRRGAGFTSHPPLAGRSRSGRPSSAWSARVAWRGRAKACAPTRGAGLGYVWGDGKLTYQGTTRAFQVHGLSAVGVGAETIQGTAEVYHLNRIEDFPGVYVAAGAGGAVGEAGGGTAVLTNRHGVEIRLHTRERGLELNIAASGLGISWAPGTTP